jgi:hypothetical protein
MAVQVKETLRPLAAEDMKEFGQVTLSSEVSKSNMAVKWFKDERSIYEDTRHQVKSRHATPWAYDKGWARTL